MITMIDDYKHQGLRRQLVTLMKEKGISNQAVLEAIGKVPRHYFMDGQFDHFAYKDMAFKIGAGQTISQPYTVAMQSTLLQVTKGMKVLEIGTGSGYQASILMELGVKLFSIERQKTLFDNSKKILEKMNYKPRLFFGDGFAGLPAFAPFERIIVTCGAPGIPEKLVEQLKPGGRMVIPVGEGDTQVMKLILKKEDGSFTEEEHGIFKFVPMLKDKAND
jgi:protein-L-isoaspartate(D-aspartate) O-methyltransferase